MPPQPFSQCGEQNVKADIAYEGPTDKQYMADPEAHFRLDINTLSMESAAGTFSLDGHVSSQPQGGERALSIAFHEKAEGTELGDRLSRKRFYGYPHLAAESPGADRPGHADIPENRKRRRTGSHGRQSVSADAGTRQGRV